MEVVISKFTGEGHKHDKFGEDFL